MKRHTSLALIVIALATVQDSVAADWPQWRGPYRTGRSDESGLLQEWPEEGPAVSWSVRNAGVGYSSMSVSNGRLFTQGDLDGVEHILCYDAKTGDLLWAVQPGPVAEQLTKRVDDQFARLDKDEDGVLSEVEAIEGMGRMAASAEQPLEGDPEAIANDRVARLLEALDKDRSASLEFAEIPRQVVNDYLSRIDRPAPGVDIEAVAEQRTAAALKLDKDEDGTVSQQESRGTIVQLLFGRVDKRKPGERRGDGKLTKEELTEYFANRERGRDGVVSAEELQTYFKRTYPGRDGVLTKADVLRHYGGYRNSYGDGPRGTPTVDGDVVYAEGGSGDLSCLDAETGKTIWHLNLQADLKGGRPGWGYSESPLVVGDLLIVTPGGGQGTLAALDKSTGDLVWRSTDTKEGAHYSSPMFASIAGVDQIVQFARSSVFGVDLKNGNALWKYSKANNGTANACTPIIDGDNVLVSSNYGVGSGMVKVSAADDGQSATEVWFEKKLACHHGGLVKVGDHVYGFGQGLMCLDFKTGNIEWQSRSVGKGSLMYADGHLYCLGERNEVALVEANPEEYVEKGRFRIEKTDRPSWAHPVVANGRFYIRDQGNLTCYDVRAK